jgi:hypothetical protein
MSATLPPFRVKPHTRLNPVSYRVSKRKSLEILCLRGQYVHEMNIGQALTLHHSGKGFTGTLGAGKPAPEEVP